MLTWGSYEGVDLHEFDDANLVGESTVNTDLGVVADFWGSCASGYVDNVQRFLSGGQDPNAPNNRHEPPLHLACRHNRRAVVEVLLRNGANMYGYVNTKTTTRVLLNFLPSFVFLRFAFFFLACLTFVVLLFLFCCVG